MPDKKICLLDSNIWLYAFMEGQDAKKSKTARLVIQNQEISIALSTQIINEVCVNLVRKAHFPEEKIQKLIESFHSKYFVVGMDKEILISASKIRSQHSFSYWDSLVFASALFVGAEILYSEDMQDGFIIEGTKIVNPFR